MEIELTKSAKKSIAALYSEYKKRLKNETAQNAVLFQLPFHAEIYNSVKPDLPELKRLELVKTEVRAIILTPKAIAFMEQKDAGTIKEWLSFIAQFIP